jgi:thiaminase/transcriptional activator TenA
MARFTDELRALAGTKWNAVVEHRFTDELAAGTVADGVLARYLIQDHRFLDAFVVLLASMVAAAPTLADRIPGCQFLALITGRENTYFERSFDALGVDKAARVDTPNAPPTSAFDGLMREAAKASYPEMLAVLVVAEWRCIRLSARAMGRLSLPLTLTATAMGRRFGLG